MTDVEELLRDTLADSRRKLDPPPGIYETVAERARGRRRRRSTIAAASMAVVAVAVAGSVAGVRASGGHAPATGHPSTPVQPTPVQPTPVRPTTTGVPQGTLSVPVYFGSGQAAGIALAGRSNTNGSVPTDVRNDLYVLTRNPSRIVLLFAWTASIEATGTGPSGAPSGIAVGDSGAVWAWSHDTGEVRAYEATTLSPLGTFQTQLRINSGAVVDGDLFLATDDGLFHEDPASDAVTPSAPTTAVEGVTGSVYSIAADPAQHRVLIVADNVIEAVDARTGAVTVGAATGLTKMSVAVVNDQVWAGGFASGDVPRLVRLDTDTLRVVSSFSPKDISPGAILWPGASVLWVGNGGLLDCVDSMTGATLEQWPAMQGPVVSARTAAYGVSDGNVYVLSGLAGGCEG